MTEYLKQRYNDGMIVCMGEILVDMINEEGQGFVPHLGGAPFNVAVGAHRNDADCTFVGTVGDDLWGDYIIKQSGEYGVKCHIARDNMHATPLAFVTIQAGERTFGFVRKDAADSYLDMAALCELLPKANVLHMGSLPLSTEVGRQRMCQAVKQAHDLGVKVSFDVNLRDGIWTSPDQCKQETLQMIRQCDLIKMSEEEWTKLSPEIEDIVEHKPNKAICVTLGAEGALLYKDCYQSYVPGVQVEAVDTTGAGDAFWGSMLASIDKLGREYLLSHEDLVGMIEKANNYAAMSVTHFGAI